MKKSLKNLLAGVLLSALCVALAACEPEESSSERKKITVYIQVDYSGAGADMPSFYPFWGLYPKLPELPIKVVRE